MANNRNYKPKEFAELLGVSVATLQRWDRQGTLHAHRSITDRRYYTYDQYLERQGVRTPLDERKIVIYTRVSTRNQKEDLNNLCTAQQAQKKQPPADIPTCFVGGWGIRSSLSGSATTFRFFYF